MNLPSRESDSGPRYEAFRSSDLPQCGSCGASCAELEPCVWDVTLMVCPACAPDLDVEQYEAEVA